MDTAALVLGDIALYSHGAGVGCCIPCAVQPKYTATVVACGIADNVLGAGATYCKAAAAYIRPAAASSMEAYRAYCIVIAYLPALYHCKSATLHGYATATGFAGGV